MEKILLTGIITQQPLMVTFHRKKWLQRQKAWGFQPLGSQTTTPLKALTHPLKQTENMGLKLCLVWKYQYLQPLITLRLVT